MLRNWFFGILSLCISTGCFAAGDPAITSVSEAGPEYALQGEYVGKVGSEGKTFGAQIIALGKGQFKAVAYPGGLPGEGADMSAEQIVSEGRMEGASVVFSNEVHTGRIADGRIVITANADNSVVGELQRIERVSATIDAKPPEGALVLFDGKSAAAFKGGRLTQDNLLDVGCETSEQFGDHHLHIEFRTPFMPLSRGQSRGNSGVYIQGRYELQVLDSFGLSGENNECGGIYQIAKPAINMCYPPLVWQTYDIDFTAAKYDATGKKTTNARVTIKHNGVVIHKDLELPHGTPARMPKGLGRDHYSCRTMVTPSPFVISG